MCRRCSPSRPSEKCRPLSVATREFLSLLRALRAPPACRLPENYHPETIWRHRLDKNEMPCRSLEKMTRLKTHLLSSAATRGQSQRQYQLSWLPAFRLSGIAKARLGRRAADYWCRDRVQLSMS